MSVIPGQKAPDERRRILLASAIEEFAVHGYDGASTNRIAKKAQVAKGLIFRYFDSKEGLFEAALDQACERIFSPPGAPLPTDPFERLEEFLVRRATAIAEHPSEARLVAQFRGQACRVASPLTCRLRSGDERAAGPVSRGGDSTRLFPAGRRSRGGARADGVGPRGLEGSGCDFISVEMASSGATASSDRPFAADGRIESGAASLPFVEPEAVRHRARAVIESRPEKGIYRPGASARPNCPWRWIRDRSAPFHGRSPRRIRAPRRGSRFCERLRSFLPSGVTMALRRRSSLASLRGRCGERAGLSPFRLQGGSVYGGGGRCLGPALRAFFADVGPPPSDLFQRLFDWMHHKLLIFQMQPTLSCLALSAFADPPASLRDRIRSI